MADPRAVVPYHDPYENGLCSDIINFLYDSERPILDENVPLPPLDDEGLTCPTNPISLFDEGIQDLDDPLLDQATWDFLNQCSNGGGNVDSQAGPSHIIGESSGTSPPRGDNIEQNQGFGDPVPLSVWPAIPVPFNCSCCQLLREIIHSNGNHVMKFDIHGRFGMISHAILHSFDVKSSDNHQYQMFDFCKKSIKEVKQFLMQYCLERKLEGYIMQRDPMAIFYEALCVGLEWDDIRNTNDFTFPPSPLNSGRAGEVEQQQRAADQPEAAEDENERISLAAQRERTANMSLDDLRGYFHLPIQKAARRLKVCPTVVKRICRRNGLNRWPSRKIRSINRQISRLTPSLESDDANTRVHAEAEISRLEREIAELVP
ncbi:unnamed protein product [Malus baccata var. baccata]